MNLEKKFISDLMDLNGRKNKCEFDYELVILNSEYRYLQDEIKENATIINMDLLNQMIMEEFTNKKENDKHYRLDLTFPEQLFNLEESEILSFIELNLEDISIRPVASPLLVLALNKGYSKVASYCIENVYKRFVGQELCQLRPNITNNSHVSYHCIKLLKDLNLLDNLLSYHLNPFIEKVIKKTDKQGLKYITDNFSYFIKSDENSKNLLLLLIKNDMYEEIKSIDNINDSYTNLNKKSAWDFYHELLNSRNNNTTRYLKLILDKYNTLNMRSGKSSLLNSAIKYKNLDVFNFILENGGDFTFTFNNACKSGKGQLNIEIKKALSEGDEIPESLNQMKMTGEILSEKKALSTIITNKNTDNVIKKRL